LNRAVGPGSDTHFIAGSITAAPIPPSVFPFGPFGGGAGNPTGSFASGGGAVNGGGLGVVTTNNTNAPTPLAPPPPTAPALIPGFGGGKGGRNPFEPKLPGIGVGSKLSDQSFTNLEIGVVPKVTLLYDLNDAKTYFVELWGAYHWSIPADMHGSYIDLRSFEAGVGVGLRF
jgi:hypothetical protein